jgi:hypothetical protein
MAAFGCSLRAIALKRQYLPKAIYKYRSDNINARENLRSNTIWLASPESYNDPYDCLLRFSGPSMTSAFEKGLIDPFIRGYGLEIPNEKINEAKQSATPLETLSQNISGVGKPGVSPKQIAEYFSKMVPKYVQTTVNSLQVMRGAMKLCSFSAVNDSILMWSHYGSHHQGFCVEYDIEQFDPADPFLRNLYPVVYSHEVFDLTPWAEKLVTGNREEFNPYFPLLGVLQKYDGWAYEKEWRYVLFQEAASPSRTRSVPTPSRVLLGARMPEHNKKELVEICAAKRISVWEMQMSSDRYELQAAPLSV